LKASVRRPATGQIVFVVAVGVSLLIAAKLSAQATTGTTSEMERVIVTGSNIPAAEETGLNPVDTYRPSDVEKLGIRNSTDLLTNLPQEMGTLTISNSTVSGNSAAMDGGGIYNSGGYRSSAGLSVNNSTFSANSATGSGG